MPPLPPPSTFLVVKFTFSTSCLTLVMIWNFCWVSALKFIENLYHGIVKQKAFIVKQEGETSKQFWKYIFIISKHRGIARNRVLPPAISNSRAMSNKDSNWGVGYVGVDSRIADSASCCTRWYDSNLNAVDDLWWGKESTKASRN
jgi:hypothetical protein